MAPYLVFLSNIVFLETAFILGGPKRIDTVIACMIFDVRDASGYWFRGLNSIGHSFPFPVLIPLIIMFSRLVICIVTSFPKGFSGIPIKIVTFRLKMGKFGLKMGKYGLKMGKFGLKMDKFGLIGAKKYASKSNIFGDTVQQLKNLDIVLG